MIKSMLRNLLLILHGSGFQVCKPGVMTYYVHLDEVEQFIITLIILNHIKSMPNIEDTLPSNLAGTPQPFSPPDNRPQINVPDLPVR